MKTINLLPKPRQQEMRYEKIFHSVLVFIALSLVSYALIFVMQFGARVYLQQQALSVQARIKDLQGQYSREDNTAIRQKIKAINDVVADYRSLAAGAPRWSKVLRAFAKLPPPDVRIYSLSADRNSKSISIQGFSPSRELVIAMYNAIKNDDKEFYNVDYPLENVARATNINFHFTFFIKDELLK